MSKDVAIKLEMDPKWLAELAGLKTQVAELQAIAGPATKRFSVTVEMDRPIFQANENRYRAEFEVPAETHEDARAVVLAMVAMLTKREPLSVCTVPL